MFSPCDDDGSPGALTDLPAPSPPDGDALDRGASLLAKAQRPVIMAGTNAWWATPRPPCCVWPRSGAYRC
ncbi:acetolactate synthase domain protein [Mycobacterium xenopi 4042]|uniref:Acetolactate synthase domain protein n=1 Tax=Mycobacterium xenopi 4042 TaxID=1299334 RepID=X8BGL2_MYCXE|nr:acetolactate synthase domain protein [Mycobacterium xenopi 4042]